MHIRFLKLGRLQSKVLGVISVIVIVPMLVAGWFAAEWVSESFEQRLESWIRDAARTNLDWLQADHNDALLLGRVLADDPAFVAALDRLPAETNPVPAGTQRIARELGVDVIQVYGPNQRLLYSSLPIEMQNLWERGQTEAVLKVHSKRKSILAAVGITPIPARGPVRYYVVLGSLLGEEFTRELAQLTGLKSRLYYRVSKDYFDVFSAPGKTISLAHLPRSSLTQLEKTKKPLYSVTAENGEYRGMYTPIVDSTGRVEAIMFSGLERRGPQEVLTSRLSLFGWIALLGVIIGVLTGWFLSRLVVRPLEYLRNGVMQLAGQNFSVSVPVQSDDELGDLAKAFNAMSTRLREAHDEQLQRFQKDKLAAMGEMSAALAHEIRNPLGVVNTSAALLERTDDPAKRAQLVRMIREESMRVSTLVQDFLHLSRHRQPTFEPLNPSAPMEYALALALALAGRDDVRVHRRFRHEGVLVLADAGLLQQAWSNLFTNAIQAMPESKRELWLTTEVVDGAVRLTLEDSGPGVPADIMPRLFEPFFTTKAEGTGLGLTIAYTLIEANGGRLEALPRGEHGGRFVVQLRIHEGVGR